VKILMQQFEFDDFASVYRSELFAPDRQEDNLVVLIFVREFIVYDIPLFA
jgi:hypothetical protein